MNLKTAAKSGFKNWLDFSGRASRSEYWFFYLSVILLFIAAGILDAVMGFGAFYLIAVIVTTVPQLSVAVRRLHDMDKSGWWLLLMMIPLIGIIILLIWFCSKGTNGPNRFGADPLQKIVV